jgi:hypothetical protein
MCIPQSVSPSTVGNVGVGLQVAGVFSSSVGAYQQSKATKAALEYQAAVDRNNAQLDEYRAKDSLERGAIEVNKQQLKTGQLKGTQRAALAARGLALDDGSALNILADTDYMGQVDADTIADNAAREAWAYRESAKGNRSNASMRESRAASESPFRSAANTLLTGAGSVATSWYALRTKRESASA